MAVTCCASNQTATRLTRADIWWANFAMSAALAELVDQSVSVSNFLSVGFCLLTVPAVPLAMDTVIRASGESLPEISLLEL